MSSTKIHTLLAQILTAFAGIILLVYLYSYLFLFPDLNIQWDWQSREITAVDNNQIISSKIIQPGYRIVSIGGYDFSTEYVLPGKPSILSLINPDRTLELTVEGNGNREEVLLVVRQPDGPETFRRLLDAYPAIVFLLSASVVLLLLRPKDTRWFLLIVNFNLLAIALAAGIMFGDFNILWSNYVFIASFWPWTAAFTHLFWVFPRSIHPLPRYAIAGIYLGVGLLGVADILNILPNQSHLLGFAATLLAGLSLLLMQLFQRNQRQEMTLLLVSMVVLILLMITVVSFSIQGHAITNHDWVTFLLMPVMPLVLLYPLVRRQIPDLEIRANLAFINLLFAMIMIILYILLVVIVQHIHPSSNRQTADSIAIVTLLTISAVFLYPWFRQWAQHRLLGVSPVFTNLIQNYAGRIATSLETNRLAALLCNEVMPALMIQQAVLFRLSPTGQPSLLMQCGIEENLVPSVGRIQELLQHSSHYLPYKNYEDTRNTHWVRLVLKLEAADQLVGVCLLGRRDPDDYYAAEEIPFFQSLMDQTALAIFNIEQAERLRTYHQLNIQRHEQERIRLARDLHDDVLGQLALIQMNLPSSSETEGFKIAYETVVSQVRTIVNGLRPALLEYGLCPALQGLADDLMLRAKDTDILVNVTSDENPRYSADFEIQVYRITQEACQNAIRHGQATKIILHGYLKPGEIYLSILDNGKGFQPDETLDLTNLLRQGHYGLANIFERAQLIGAQVTIQSTPEKGTHLILEWKQQHGFNHA